MQKNRAYSPMFRGWSPTFLWRNSIQCWATPQSTSRFLYNIGAPSKYSKSSIFVVGRHPQFSEAVRDLFQFPVGELHVHYLGVPLLSTKLTATNCKPLVDRITSRISCWTSRFLSFAGWLQLIKSVLCGIQSFWNGLFILPKAVIKQIEQILRQFLWKGS